jgi:site-specific recombinase XerD
VRGKIRLKHYSIRTEQAYVDWIKRFVLHFDKRHPAEMDAREVEAFLTHLAVQGRVAAATQNQAKAALLFLYREVLEQDLPWLQNVEQAKAPKRLPVVLTQAEAQAVLSRLPGTHWLVAGLLYGSGLRIMEALRLRVKDVEFARGEILVREGKGFKDRVTMLPSLLVEPLKAHLKKVRALHEQDGDDDDLYACAEQGRARCGEPAGPLGRRFLDCFASLAMTSLQWTLGRHVTSFLAPAE